jgi:hypothetical protein
MADRLSALLTEDGTPKARRAVGSLSATPSLPPFPTSKVGILTATAGLEVLDVRRLIYPGEAASPAPARAD